MMSDFKAKDNLFGYSSYPPALDNEPPPLDDSDEENNSSNYEDLEQEDYNLDTSTTVTSEKSLRSVDVNDNGHYLTEELSTQRELCNGEHFGFQGTSTFSDNSFDNDEGWADFASFSGADFGGNADESQAEMITTADSVDAESTGHCGQPVVTISELHKNSKTLLIKGGVDVNYHSKEKENNISVVNMKSSDSIRELDNTKEFSDQICTDNKSENLVLDKPSMPKDIIRGVNKQEESPSDDEFGSFKEGLHSSLPETFNPKFEPFIGNSASSNTNGSNSKAFTTANVICNSLDIKGKQALELESESKESIIAREPSFDAPLPNNTCSTHDDFGEVGLSHCDVKYQNGDGFLGMPDCNNSYTNNEQQKLEPSETCFLPTSVHDTSEAQKDSSSKLYVENEGITDNDKSHTTYHVEKELATGSVEHTKCPSTFSINGSCSDTTAEVSEQSSFQPHQTVDGGNEDFDDWASFEACKLATIPSQPSNDQQVNNSDFSFENVNATAPKELQALEDSGTSEITKISFEESLPTENENEDDFNGWASFDSCHVNDDVPSLTTPANVPESNTKSSAELSNASQSEPQITLKQTSSADLDSVLSEKVNCFTDSYPNKLVSSKKDFDDIQVKKDNTYFDIGTSQAGENKEDSDFDDWSSFETSSTSALHNKSSGNQLLSDNNITGNNVNNKENVQEEIIDNNLQTNTPEDETDTSQFQEDSTSLNNNRNLTKEENDWASFSSFQEPAETNTSTFISDTQLADNVENLVDNNKDDADDWASFSSFNNNAQLTNRTLIVTKETDKIIAHKREEQPLPVLEGKPVQTKITSKLDEKKRHSQNLALKQCFKVSNPSEIVEGQHDHRKSQALELVIHDKYLQGEQSVWTQLLKASDKEGSFKVMYTSSLGMKWMLSTMNLAFENIMPRKVQSKNSNLATPQTLSPASSISSFDLQEMPLEPVQILLNDVHRRPDFGRQTLLAQSQWKDEKGNSVPRVHSSSSLKKDSGSETASETNSLDLDFFSSISSSMSTGSLYSGKGDHQFSGNSLDLLEVNFSAPGEPQSKDVSEKAMEPSKNDSPQEDGLAFKSDLHRRSGSISSSQSSLASCKSVSLSADATTFLNELEDLSYVTSSVLMFPTILLQDRR